MRLQGEFRLKEKPKKPAKTSPNKQRISYTMSRVRSSGSAIELALGKALWAVGLRYRKQYPIFGRPDFVLVKHRIAIFCDSEFWHGFRWGKRRKSEHKTNQSYWFRKIERNRTRDRLVDRTLKQQGWRVVRFWECEILTDPTKCGRRVAEYCAFSSRR
ncbi:MAG: very short patch repair endonuclease [Chthoniobacterales bacterium]|nr:MAG: very short patch repair endonuclease [Chthoniobacterales bacterium]